MFNSPFSFCLFKLSLSKYSHHSHFSFPVRVFQIPVCRLPAHRFCLVTAIMKTILTMIITTSAMIMTTSAMIMTMNMTMTMEEGTILPETQCGASFMRQCSSGIKNPIRIRITIGDGGFDDNIGANYIVSHHQHHK